MRYLTGLVKLILFVLLLSFAVKNTDPVVLRYYLGYQWQMPLVLLVLLVFSLGAAIGVAASLGYLYRGRIENQRLKRELARCRALPADHPPAG